jgi:nucleotide-binding universal stress UspA family protein
MTILCGVDFSEASRVAVRAAAALATLSREDVILVHAAEYSEAAEGSLDLLALQRARIHRKAEKLRERGLTVTALVTPGVPDEVLLSVARQHSARCIVVGAFGHRERRVPELGSHADRLAHEAHLPVLVVRDATPFEAWAAGERPLKVRIGLDLSGETPSAVAWLAELCQLGSCEVTGTHLYWPPKEWGRLGLSGVRPFLSPEPDVTRAVERDFEVYRAALRSAARLDLSVEPNLGSLGSRLAELASDHGDDLIVVGSRSRGTFQRWWEGSVSRSVLEYASTSVVCVPGEHGAARVPRAGAGSVLCATDFSELGNSAIPVAYQMVGLEGTLHLIHVTTSSRADSIAPHDIFEVLPDQDAICKRLASLVPEQLAGRIKTELHVLRAANCGEAICQAAERLGAGTICIGTHGRTGIARAVLGSVAARVLAQSERRVLLVRPPVERAPVGP